jgi:4-hydroxy-2-oxoheptanedioate aldolase
MLMAEVRLDDSVDRSDEDRARTIGERLRSGEALVGTVIGAPDAALAELTAAPFDVVWLDLEHSPLSIRDVHELTVAVQATGCACLVRAPAPRSEALTAVLDCGVDGIVLPRVERADDVRALLARLRYPPDGTRGFAHRRASGWGRRPRRLDVPACLVQVESRAGLAALDAIAAVPGLDAIVVGTADLALDLEAPLPLDGEALGGAVLAGALRRVREASERAGVGFGIAAAGPPAAIASQLGQRGGLVVYSADVRIFAAAVDRAAADVRAALAARAVRG